MTGEAAFEGNLAGNVTPDFLSEAMGIVWDEAEKKDRRILELKTGFGGKNEPMTPKDVALQLGISPVELSRRSARLGAKLDELLEQLDKS
jgi:DNA-directed RNA polymerase specialized sigma subunit